MLQSLITSKTRIKLLLKFFLNTSSSSYLRALESEFGESSNAIRIELNRFEKAGLLRSFTQGNRKYYQVNNFHPMFRDIRNLVMKYVGIDEIIDRIVKKLGDPDRVFLTGSLAEGRDAGIIDLIFIGAGIDTAYLMRLVEKTEDIIKRKIRYMVMREEEFDWLTERYKGMMLLLIWSEGEGDHGITGSGEIAGG